MEVLMMILGLAVLYTWIHAVVLILRGNSWQEKTTYEKTVVILAISFAVLYLID